MTLIQDRHQTLFEEKTKELLTDLGDTVTLYISESRAECTWCILDSVTDRSSGMPASGKDWSTHADYQNDLLCPQCSGSGYVTTWNTVTLSKTHVEDISGETYVRGKAAYFEEGTKRITGLLDDIISGSTNYLETAKKIIINDDDYQLRSYERIGIKSNYLFRAVVERSKSGTY